MHIRLIGYYRKNIITILRFGGDIEKMNVCVFGCHPCCMYIYIYVSIYIMLAMHAGTEVHKWSVCDSNRIIYLFRSTFCSSATPISVHSTELCHWPNGGSVRQTTVEMSADEEAINGLVFNSIIYVGIVQQETNSTCILLLWSTTWQGSIKSHGRTPSLPIDRYYWGVDRKPTIGCYMRCVFANTFIIHWWC